MTSAKSSNNDMEQSGQTDLQKALSVLNGYIEEQGMRKTPERATILKTVMQMEGHHSADEILAMMPVDFHVSRASIYSTLKLLDELAIVVSHQIHGITLYERVFGTVPHHHYICRGCHRIWDLHNPDLGEMASKCRTPRFRKTHYSVYIHGICDVCQARLNRLKKKMEQQKAQSMSREEKRFARIDKELTEAAKWF